MTACGYLAYNAGKKRMLAWQWLANTMLLIGATFISEGPVALKLVVAAAIVLGTAFSIALRRLRFPNV